MDRLSPLQLAALMLCARCFSMMTYFPYSGSNTLIFMAAVVISTALQWLILLPVSVLCTRRGKGICELALSRGRVLGIAVTAAFALYFLWDIFVTTGTFAYFMDNYFSNQISRVPAVICVVGAAVYLGSLGSAPLGRCGGIFFCVFAFFTAIMLASTVQQPDFANFHLAQRDIPQTLAGDISAELVRNRELVMLAFLLGGVNGSKHRAVLSYLGVKLVLLEILLGFAALVLGSFAGETDMPFFYLSCLSNSSVIERYDAGFMSVWTVLGVVRLAAGLHCIGRCVQLLCGGRARRSAVLAAQILPAAATFFLLTKRRWKELAYLRESPWLMIAVAAVIPLAVSVIVRRRRKNETK